MRINSAVLLMLFLLVAAVGWFAAGAASPNLVTLLMGVAIRMIISMPVTLVVARLLWSDQVRAIRRYDRIRRSDGMPHATDYPPVLVVHSRQQRTEDHEGPIYRPQHERRDPALIHYLGEE